MRSVHRVVLIALVIFGLIRTVYGQSTFPELFSCAVEFEDTIFNTESNICIYIISDPRCGYCGKAIKEIGEWARDKRVEVIAMDVSEKADRIRSHEALQYYNDLSIHIVDASPCGMKYKKFIPKIFVYSESGEKICRFKGWTQGDLEKLSKRLDKYL